jgi:hypothetical protein
MQEQRHEHHSANHLLSNMQQSVSDHSRIVPETRFLLARPGSVLFNCFLLSRCCPLLALRLAAAMSIEELGASAAGSCSACIRMPEQTKQTGHVSVCYDKRHDFTL